MVNQNWEPRAGQAAPALHQSDIPWRVPAPPILDLPEDLEELAVGAVTDAVTYRELLLETLAAVAQVSRDRDRLRERYRALIDQYRALRAEKVAS